MIFLSKRFVYFHIARDDCDFLPCCHHKRLESKSFLMIKARGSLGGDPKRKKSIKRKHRLLPEECVMP